MEQEIMQNANFEWLATLFVGIFSAFAGTFLGAVLLNHLHISNHSHILIPVRLWLRYIL